MRLGIGRLRAGGSAGFSPASLFAAGEQGAWYDPSDFSTMWQDSAGTTPVTAVTQPVGKILDKSGRGNHLTQATTTSRPTLQQDGSGFFYLNFDGVDDQLAGPAWSGGAQDSLALAGLCVSLNGAYQTGISANNIIYINEVSNTWGGYNNGAVASSYAASTVRVMLEVTRSETDVDLYTDANPKENVTTGVSGGGRVFFLGGLGSQYAQMHCYAGLSVGRVLTAIEIAKLKTWLGAKVGMSL